MTPLASDPLDVVAAFRPTELLSREWSPQRSDELLRLIAATPADPAPADLLATRRHRHRRVWPAAAVLVGAAASAVLVMGVFLPSGTPGSAPPAAAAALEHLAVAAGSSPADLVQPGQFRHLVASEHQDASDSQPAQETIEESWTSYDGQFWRHDTVNGRSQYYAFPAGHDDINYPSPEFLASLPTDSTALLTYLRAHVSGSNSTDEAIFVAVGDMLRGGFAPPALRTAAIRALENTAHITTAATRDALGRDALKVTFTDQSSRPGQVQSLYFDPSTATILEDQTVAPDLNYVATYTGWAVVNTVPADVLAHAGRPEPSGSPTGSGSSGPGSSAAPAPTR